MHYDAIKKLAVIGQSANAVALGKYGGISWTVEKLHSVLSGVEDGGPCEGIALLHTANKSFWAHRIVESDWYLLATHPVVANVEKAYELNAKATKHPIRLAYEYIAFTPKIANELAKIAPLLYFSAKISTETPLALEQALLELFDALRPLLETPIDEIFARTRNMRANQAEPDLITAHLRMKNGCEGQIEAHCLSAHSPRAVIDFYGRNGQFHWDAYSDLNEQITASNSLFSDSIKSYQWVDWVERSGRFDRAINYREALK